MAGEGRKAALWKKIAAAAGIGAGAAGAAGAGFAGGRATRGDGEGRNDMSAVQGQQGQGQGQGQRQNQGQGQNQGGAERDALIKQAASIAPDSNFDGLNERQILEVLYKDDPNVKTIATDRLLGRLDMEVVGAQNAQKYIKAGDALGILGGGSNGAQSIGMTLRAMENNGMLK
jgi:hypothetical protein